MKRLCGMISGLGVLLSCSVEELRPAADLQNEMEKVTVSFAAQVAEETRSSVSPDEDAIRDVNVYAFRNGFLESYAFAEDSDDIAMDLTVGNGYNIYAVANLGRCEMNCTEDEFARLYEYSVSRLSDLSDLIPMSCVVTDVNVVSSPGTIVLNMERKAARITLSVDKEALLEGLQVQSVRLCQCASRVFPFRWHGDGGSRVLSASETIDGDYATASDLRLLNDGKEMVLYTLENCQGILLPDNTDPFKKVPMMIEDKDELCTYIDVKCSFTGQGLFDGDVSYRIYLGLDACTSFDIPGNSCIDISLMLTDEGLRTVSWKVDADVNVSDGYARGRVLEGMHDLDDLYVGEVLKYEVEVSDELMDYLGGDATGCTLGLQKEGAESDDVIFKDLSYEDDVMTVELWCRRPGNAALYLYSPEGECLGCLDDCVTVRMPQIKFSEYPAWTDDSSVDGLTYLPECEINGTSAEFYIYLVDEDGCNLNGVRSYGFDSSLFSFQDGGAEMAGVPVEGVRSVFGSVQSAGDGTAIASVTVQCRNSGADHDANLLLADIYSEGRPVLLGVIENHTGMSADAKVGLGIPQIALTLVDNGWAGYHDCQLSLVVDNPSNLPLDVSVWQLVATDSRYESVNREYVEENLVLEHMQYMTGEFYNGAPPFYGASSSFVSERNECGDKALMRQSLLIYPLKGISSDDIIMAVNYDRRGANQMIHVVDAAITGHRIREEDLTLVDSVSDGSATYDYLYYGDDSRNYQGASLFSWGVPVSAPRTWKYDYPNMSAVTLDRMYERYLSSGAVRVMMIYAPDEGKTAVMTYVGQGAQYGLSLSFLYSGVVNGYVQTYPKGTWFAAQDNYCSTEFSHQASTVPLRATSSFIWADAGQLKAAMDGIYAHSYKDSPRPLGSDSYMHRAHPTDMDLEMNILVEGDEGKELYPFYVDWDSDYLEYWHEQDATKYKCNLSSECQCFSFVMVRPK